MDYHVWGAILEAFRKLKSKPKTSAELKEALQVIWGNMPQGPIDKAVKDVSNKTTLGWCCSLELAEDTSNIHSDNGILASEHYLTVLFEQCYWIGAVAGTFFNAEKSEGGDDKKSITSSFFNRITFYLAWNVKGFSK